jgi:hypothetical protein
VIDGWREATEGVDDGEHADLAAGGELVVDEVHCLGLVDLTCIGPIFTQLGFQRRFGVLLRNCRPLTPYKGDRRV